MWVVTSNKTVLSTDQKNKYTQMIKDGLAEVPLKFFRYNGKRYTFKTPIIFRVVDTPDYSQEDDEDQGDFYITNDEWEISATDISLDVAIQDAELYFSLHYGWYLDNDNSDITLEKIMNAPGWKYSGLSFGDTKAKRKELIKQRRDMKDKLLGMIKSIDDDDSAPWCSHE